MQLNLYRARISSFLILHEKSLIRLVVLLLALAASGIIAPLAAHGALLPMLVLVLYYGFIGLLAFLRWPGITFPMIAFASLVVPFSIGTGTQTSINLPFLLVALSLGLWIFDMVAVKKQVRIINSRPVLPALLFIVVTFIAFGFGQLLWFPIRGASIMSQLGGVGIFVLSAGAFILTAHRMETRWLQWMVWTFLILSAVYVIGVLVPPLRYFVYRTFQRAVLDSMFWTWLTALSFSQAFLNKRLHIGLRGGLGLLAFASLYITFVIKQSWTSGWLPSAVTILVILLLTKPRLSILGGFVMGLLLLIRSQAATSFMLAGDNEYSLMTRLEAWKIMMEIIKLNPLFGVGPSNYYFYTPFFSILGYNVSFNSHNNYIDIMAQTGLIGLGMFGWFSIEVGRVAWWLRGRLTDAFQNAFLFGAIGGLAGTLVAGMLGDWILPFVYNIGMEGFRASVLAWIFLGALVMLEQNVRQPAETRG